MSAGMGELQVLFGTSLPEEVTSGDTSCRIIVPCNMQLEAVGVQPVVLFGNTVTTAAGIVFARLSGTALATSTTIATVLMSAGATVDLTLKAGDGIRSGMTKVKGTKAWAVGECVVKNVTPQQLHAGERLAVFGSATVMSATGDFVPFVLVRVAGIDPIQTNVYSDLSGPPRLSDVT